MNYLPRNLTFDRGVAYINGVSLLEVSKEHATPLYVFDWDGVEQNIVEFKALIVKYSNAKADLSK